MLKNVAILLCVFLVNVKATNLFNTSKKGNPTECPCCKNCKELCRKWCAVVADENKSEAGKKVKEECTKICIEKKCCSIDGKCEGMMERKDCCKRK